MFKSIFERFFWTNAAVLLVVFVTVTASMTVFGFKYTSNKHYKTVTDAAKGIEEMTIHLQIEHTDSVSNSIYLSTLEKWGNFIDSDIIIVNQAGNVYASTVDITDVPPEYYTQVLTGEIIEKKTNFGDNYKKKIVMIGMPLYYEENIIGGMFFNSHISGMNRLVFEILYMLFISTLLSIIIAFVFIYFQSKMISKPIMEVNKAAMDIAAGKFEQRVTVTSGDEIGQLASSFNCMADSLERLEEMRSRFVSDVSHELRTPMTSISGFIQGILDHTIPEEKEDEYLNIVLEETNRLTRLVNNMLESSKISSLQYNLDMEEFDIAEITRRVIIQLESKISKKDLEIDVDFEEDIITVLADKDSIRRVILNILDNAVKFSYNSTTIEIKIWSDSGKVYVCIGNYGMGIESSEMKTVFDRFYKTDKSRSRDKQGAGLGLYLVKNILLCHKQDIWVESTDVPNANMKYTKFTFTLERV